MGSSRAVSPGRAGGVKAFASNIDVHGVRGIQAGYQKDQPQQQQQQQPQQQQRGGGIESMSAAELKQVLYSHYSTAGNLSQEDRQEFLEIVQEVQDRDELLELCHNEGLSDATDNI